MREFGTNPTLLTLAELKTLRTRPDLWAENLTHGMNNDVYLLADRVHVVRLAKERREVNPFRARPYAIAEAMRRLDRHPNIEQVIYAYEDDDECIVISRYRPNLIHLSDIAKQKDAPNPLESDDALRTLIDVCAFMDECGVLHKDLCDWNIFFDRDTRAPFVLDFDSMRLIDWTGANIVPESIAIQFERDASTLRLESLNIDDLQENFLFEAFFFAYDDQEAFGIEVFRRFLSLQRDHYCPRMTAYFQSIGREDLAQMMRLRQEKIAAWLSNPVRLQILYRRKRMHFLMRAVNWASEVRESSEYDVQEFLGTTTDALDVELYRREQDILGAPLVLLPAPPADPPRTEAITPQRWNSRPFERLPVDVSEENTFSPDIPKPAGALRLIAIGDVHGKVKRIIRMEQIANALKQHYAIDALLALGDMVEGGADIDGARIAIRRLRNMGVLVGALGNHEFDYNDLDALEAGERDLRALRETLDRDDPRAATITRQLAEHLWRKDPPKSYRDWITDWRLAAQFPILCANMTHPSLDGGAIALWGGKPILLLSAITPSIAHELEYHKRRGFPTPAALRPEHPRDLLLEQVRTVKAQYPQLNFIVIVLSHCGINFDRAELVHPEFDLILGSHTHNLAHFAAEWGTHQTHLVYGGQNAYYLPLVDVSIRDDGRVTDVRYTLIDVDESKVRDDYSPPPSLFDGKKLAHAETGFPLEGKSTRSTALMRLITDAMRGQSGADLALTYGLARESLSKGGVTEGDLALVMPFPDQAVIVELTAAHIRQILEYAVWSSRIDVAKKCVMFHPSGFRWSLDADLTIHLELPPGETYRVCAPRYLLEGFGDAFPLTRPYLKGELTVTWLDRSVRDLLTAEVIQRGTLSADHDEGRIVISRDAPMLYNDPTIAY